MLIMERGRFDRPAASLRGLNFIEKGDFNESCSGKGL